jgi:hypothetical protein
MRNSDRKFRMAIMPEGETLSSVVADQAAERKRLRPRSKEDSPEKIRGRPLAAGQMSVRKREAPRGRGLEPDFPLWRIRRERRRIKNLHQIL